VQAWKHPRLGPQARQAIASAQGVHVPQPRCGSWPSRPCSASCPSPPVSPPGSLPRAWGHAADRGDLRAAL